MSNQNQHLAIVNRIPVDQEAPAHYPVKKFLLEKMRIIFQNKQIIRQASLAQKRRQILEAYRRSVGFNAKLKALRNAQEKLKKAEEVLMDVGLGAEGQLLGINERHVANGIQYQIYWNNAWLPASEHTVKQIKKVEELIKAVEGESDPFTIFDQLETRMMMASKVGELMAVINAVAEEPIFNIKSDLLLRNGSQE